MAWGQAHLQLLDRRLGKNPGEGGVVVLPGSLRDVLPKVPGEQEWLAFPSLSASQRLVGEMGYI